MVKSNITPLAYAPRGVVPLGAFIRFDEPWMARNAANQVKRISSSRSRLTLVGICLHAKSGTMADTWPEVPEKPVDFMSIMNIDILRQH